MKALVLGGCGFIGSHVVDVLLDRGHSVVVFDRSVERFRPALPLVEYKYANFYDRTALIEAMTGADVIYHLLSSTFPATANLDMRADVKDNLINTLRLLELMVGLGQKRIVYLSSGGTVYGPPDVEPIPENHPLRPMNSYGIVKTTIEHYLNLYRQVHALNPVAIRAANPFGPRQGHGGVQGVIGTFLHCVRDRRPIEIWGDGSVVRDYFYVGDLAQLCVLAGEHDTPPALNAGSGVGRSLNEIIDAIGRVTGAAIAPIYKPGRTTDVPRSVLDVSKAKDSLGWTAETAFDDALEKTWHWLKLHTTQ